MATIVGKPNKTVIGTNYDDEIYLFGKSAAYGKAGNDYIHDSLSSNKMYGGDGDDTIESSGGSDSAWGGRGNDRLITSFEAGPVKFYGEAGDDILGGGISNSASASFLDGGAGNDTIYGSGSDTMRGGTGDDRLVYFSYTKYTDEVTTASAAKINGGAGNDTLGFEVSTDEGVALIEIRMTGESMGTATINGLPKLSFTGINEIVDYSFPFETNGALIYHGENADTDMTVIAGAYSSTFYGGAGNENFTSGAGDDKFIFVFNDKFMGHDKISYFGQVFPDEPDPYNPGFDTISYAGAAGKLTTVQTEYPVVPAPEYPDDYQGWTRYESFYANGRLAHVLDVDAIGLPPIGTFDGIIA